MKSYKEKNFNRQLSDYLGVKGTNKTKYFNINFKTTQTYNKPNLGAGGNRKVKVSLAKVNLPEDREE